MAFRHWTRPGAIPVPLPVTFPTPVPVSGFPALQNVNITQYLSGAVGPLNPIDVQVDNFPAGFNVNNFPATYPATQSGIWSIGVNNFPATYDVLDRAGRLLGIIYGNLGQLDQIALGGRNLATVDVQAWLGSQTPTVGQKAMAASIPVVIASDQGTFPVTVTFPSAFGITPPTGISEFADITPNGTATRFTAASTPCKGMVVRALIANAGNLRVGDSGVDASHGAELSPGSSIPIAIDNVNKVYVFAAAGTDKASMSYVT